MWLKSGLVAIGFFVALFPIYHGLLNYLKGMLTGQALLLMTITGHALFIFAAFSYPGLQACGHGRPMCIAIVDWGVALGIFILLLALYFATGALIGRIAQKILKRKQI